MKFYRASITGKCVVLDHNPDENVRDLPGTDMGRRILSVMSTSEGRWRLTGLGSTYSQG